MNHYLPHDITDQVRAIHAAHKRRRVFAVCGVAAFLLVVGLAIGSLVANGGFGRFAAIVAISAWGVQSIQWLTRRA